MIYLTSNYTINNEFVLFYKHNYICKLPAWNLYLFLTTKTFLYCDDKITIVLTCNYDNRIAISINNFVEDVSEADIMSVSESKHLLKQVEKLARGYLDNR